MAFEGGSYQELVKIAKALERIAAALENLTEEKYVEKKSPQVEGFGRPS